MFSTLRSRLWLSYFVAVSLVIVIAGLALGVYLLRNPAAERREVQRLRLVSGLVTRRSPLFNLQPERDNNRRLEDVARRADEAFEARVAVFDARGALLIDSRPTGGALPAYADLLAPRRNAIPVLKDKSGAQWLYVLTPLESGGALLLASPRPRLTLLGLMWDDLLTPVVRALLLGLGLSLLLALWMAHWIAAPLQRVAAAAQGMAEGAFEPITPGGPREVQDMARSFNAMGARVQASQRAQRDLVANVSHDLKTPLTSVQGFAQAIVDGAADDPAQVRQAAQIIYDEAGRMNRMVLDLLDLARMDAGTLSFERAPLYLEALLGSVAQKFAPQAAQAQIDLQFEPPAAEIPLIGDSDRLAQVFSNLVDNGLKFTPAGGTLRLSVHTEGEWVLVQVQDSGPGLPEAELGRIFERFYQADKARPGSDRAGRRRGVGLGLAIAREIIQGHGGQITVHNRPADTPGCVFVVRLPLARPDDETLLRRRQAV